MMPSPAQSPRCFSKAGVHSPGICSLNIFAKYRLEVNEMGTSIPFEYKPQPGWIRLKVYLGQRPTVANHMPQSQDAVATNLT